MNRKLSIQIIMLLLFIIILLTGLLYSSAFSSYFFQDDWFTLRISQAKTVNDFFSIFVPRTDVIYYRPLGMQLPFLLLQSFFGINALPFRLVTFLSHGLNIILVFWLIRLLVKRDDVALLTSFFYGTSAVHFIPFFWASTYPFVLGPTLFFFSFILFINFLDGKVKSYLVSITIFALGLLVNEMIITLPLILFIYLVLFSKKQQLKYLWPYFITSSGLFAFRLLFFPPPSTGVYHLSVGRHLLSNLKTYFFWSFNWSEILTEQMVKIFVFTKNITENSPSYASLSLISFFLIISCLVIFPAGILIYKWNRKKLKLKLLGLLWFIAGLLPVIFFPHHKFPYYLPISLVGLLMSFSLIYSYFLQSVRKKISSTFFITLIMVLAACWIGQSYATVDFNLHYHWAPRRAQIARRLLKKVQNTYQRQNPPTFIYILSTSENNLALNNQDALKILFERDDIVTIYTKDMEKAI